MIRVKWKVKEYLDIHQKTPYALWKASGLSRKTVYDITGGKLIRMDFSTLAAVIQGLETITQKRVEPNDVLEVVRDAQQ
ncbi:MAG: helix-turn-helix transcriptional regulator [Meiothermus sp.]|nr:helix-turn-helix transcriptional regulator [Meiothermus sp.]